MSEVASRHEMRWRIRAVMIGAGAGERERAWPEVWVDVVFTFGVVVLVLVLVSVEWLLLSPLVSSSCSRSGFAVPLAVAVGSRARLPLLTLCTVLFTASKHATTAHAQTRYCTHLATSHDRGVAVENAVRGIMAMAAGNPRAEGEK